MNLRLRQQLFRKLLNKGNEKGFSLIELVVAMAVLGVLIAAGIIAIYDFISISEKVVAQNSILRIKSECEANRALKKNLNFSQINLLGYNLDSDYSYSCNGNPDHGFITLIPTSNRSNPSFHYQFYNSKLSFNRVY